MPESIVHHTAWYRIYQLLEAWAERVRGERSIRLGQELAVRWMPEDPRTGIDPDVCVFEPAPEGFDDLTSLRLWEPGRQPPRLALEVVSPSHPYKDYSYIQEGYAAMGVEELVVFDPLLSGPRSLGGPVSLQLWRRDSTRSFDRVHFGNEPVYSNVLDAWFIPEERLLHLADDRKGARRWLTAAEQLVLVKAELAQATAEREQIERRLAELEKR